MKFFLFSILYAFVSILLFLYGFFLLSYDGDNSSNPKYSSDSEMHLHNTTEANGRSRIDKVVLMIIDGIRYDFLSDENVQHNMPYVYSSLNSNETCVFPCRVHLPTVTMPRIKALTAGTVPNFVDIAMNFGSSRYTKDNLLKQMIHAGKKVVFYGDDTWIKLFPDFFVRYEGTTSFFVSDFIEVDANVTRNVNEEIKQDDWDVMILHFLGLDHIGHVEGSTSLKIPRKLQEMDAVIEKLHRYLLNWKAQQQKSYLMIVSGDHGMKDAGGHGGSTLPEVLVPFITVGAPCVDRSEISQVDIAVTLSTLLGLPIPSSNVGKLINGLLNQLTESERADAYYRNCEQLMTRFTNIAEESSFFEARSLFEKAQNALNREDFRQAIAIYETLLDKMSHTLINSLTKYDAITLYFTIFFTAQSCLLVGVERYSRSAILYAVFPTSLLICILYEFCYYSRCETLFCSSWIPVKSFSWLLLYILSFNMILLMKSARTLIKQCRMFVTWVFRDSLLFFLLFGTLSHIFSSTSTSFIEEEHMTWYFLWTSLFILIGFRLFVTKKTLTVLLFALSSHRILRKLNQTGDKWSALPDINDWFRTPDNKSWLTVYTIVALIWTFFSIHSPNHCFGREKKSSNDFFQFLFRYVDIICLALIFTCKAATDEIIFPEQLKFILSYRGALEFKTILILQFVSLCSKLILIGLRRTSQNSLKNTLDVFIEFLIVWSSLLLRPYNIILIGFLYVMSNWLAIILKNESDYATKLVMTHHWLAQVYFFYQGNSNSFSSIDVTSGFIGQIDYNPIVAGVLIISATYALPILAYMCMIRHVVVYMKTVGRVPHAKSFIRSPAGVLLRLTNLHLALFMTIITLQRNHLFIWSVFSPKLLYLCVYSLLLHPFLIGLHFCSGS